jgi:RNA-directed DNA polymerase
MENRKAPQDFASETWNMKPWRKLAQHVYRIQKRIYRASQRGNTRAVHKLEKLLMKSNAARLLAVRRVTQDNQGKKTAGIDGVKAGQKTDHGRSDTPQALEETESQTGQTSVDTQARKG